MSDDRTLTDQDQRLLHTIGATADPKTFARLLMAYYDDANRADRTPRVLLYLHLGQACGLIRRLMTEDEASR